MSSLPTPPTEGTDDGRRYFRPSNPLETAPIYEAHRPRGGLPNTPLGVSLIAFLLGCGFSLGFLLFTVGGLADSWWAKYQLGFFIAAWTAFHWAEFAVTAGWNREKCSVDCEPD